MVVEEHQGSAGEFRAHTALAAAIHEGRAEDAATLADSLMAASIALVRASRAR